ncbi:thioredoxin-like domain-containing protein [Lyngbya aestuarii]|uniref:thioredoxin-like domain-containing protein n=1 Tax=Lyngbya aestuarii TaxID=118322 RepID=UPI00403E0FCB
MIRPRVRAPELPQDSIWLNTDHPLSLKDLKGRVVVLDFWSYCCINCLHVLPELKYLENKYQDSLTVIGIHSAKFDNEKEAKNIRQAVLRYGIKHPVLVDSNFQVWQQYAVKAWPTLIVIDPEGYVIGDVSGEGNRDILEQLIQDIISQHQEKGTINFQPLSFTLEKQRQSIATPLAFPGKVLADKVSDRLFIADSGHHRLVVSSLTGELLKVIGTGQVGLTDGSFSEAQFFAPQGMAIDSQNQILYVADMENHCLRRIDLENEQVLTIAGTGEQSRNIRPHSGFGLETALNSPWDLEKVGNRLLIAMAGSHQIWEMQLDTGRISTYAGHGGEACLDGVLNEVAFAQPSGITTDGQELYVADSEVSSIRGVGLFDSPSVRTVCGSGELFGFGDQDGEGSEVLLQHCLGVEYSPDYLWVADTYNHKIKRVDTYTGRCQTMLGDGRAGHRDGQSSQARFCEPSGLSAITPYLYIADTNNHAIRKVDQRNFEVKTLEISGLCAPDKCVPTAASSS